MTIPTQTAQTGGNFVVMVVDDDEMQVAYISALLTSLGVTNTMTASSGADAIAQIENAATKPDLLICDLLMPGMDGFDMMAELSTKKLFMPIIIMSAQTAQVRKSAEIVGKIKFFDVLGTVEKPVELSALKALLEKVKPA
jgi:CheY-like chemotaxis protein